MPEMHWPTWQELGLLCWVFLLVHWLLQQVDCWCLEIQAGATKSQLGMGLQAGAPLGLWAEPDGTGLCTWPPQTPCCRSGWVTERFPSVLQWCWAGKGFLSWMARTLQTVQRSWDLWPEPSELLRAWTSGTWIGSGSWGAKSGFRMANSGFDPGQYPQGGCLGWRKLADCKRRVSLAGRAFLLGGCGLESGFRVGKRRGEPDYHSHRFQEEMNYNSHEAALHIQDNDTRGSITHQPLGAVSENQELPTGGS